MNEVELKSVVDDVDARRARVSAAGGRLVEEGRLVDRRYDLPARALGSRDEVLRVRAFTPAAGGPARASVDFKGPTRHEGGYKVREELSTEVGDAETLDVVLRRSGFVITREVEREVAVYEVRGATVRFERYPRMDPLVEVEGEPDAIERAIDATGLPRGGFTAARLIDFVLGFERRTGARAALCARELSGDYPYRDDDAG
jgi:predicted adenylyl cyclase CyaB